MNCAEVINSCDALAERVGLAALSAIERTIVLVSRINFEVELGGLDSFYYNSAGNEAVASVAALEAVGATHAAEALRAANSLFPGGIPAQNREERFVGLQAVSELPSTPLDSLTREFNRDSPDVFARLCSFIKLHAAELRAHG
jgi:hypothetical protein